MTEDEDDDDASSGYRRTGRLRLQRKTAAAAAAAAPEEGGVQSEVDCEVDEWTDVAILFRVTVACSSGSFCKGENAELFAKSLGVSKYNFTVAYASDVSDRLVLPATEDDDEYNDNDDDFLDVDTNTDTNSTTDADDDANEGTIDGRSTGSSSSNTASVVVVESVQEIEKQACQQDRTSAKFRQLVLVEMIITEAAGGNDANGRISFLSEPAKTKTTTVANIDDEFQLLEDIERSYVSTYNKLATAEFCDPLFRRITGAKVQTIGTNRNTGALSLEIEVTGVCKGCDPTTVRVYEDPSSITEATTTTDTDTAAVQRRTPTIRRRRRAVEVEIEPDTIPGPWLATTTTTTTTTTTPPSNEPPDSWGSRYRTQKQQQQQSQQSQPKILALPSTPTITDGCYCDAQPFANRAPLEAEFVAMYQRSIQGLSDTYSIAVQPCEFGTSFATGLRVNFTQSNGAESLDLDDADTVSVLEDSLKKTLTELLQDGCNAEYRTVETVKVVPVSSSRRRRIAQTIENKEMSERRNIERHSRNRRGLQRQEQEYERKQQVEERQHDMDTGSRNSSRQQEQREHPRKYHADDQNGVQQKQRQNELQNDDSSSRVNTFTSFQQQLRTMPSSQNKNLTTNLKMEEEIIKIEAEFEKSTLADDDDNTTIVEADDDIFDGTSGNSDGPGSLDDDMEGDDEESDSPTFSPFDSSEERIDEDNVITTYLSVAPTNDPILLFFISGACSGCDDRMFLDLGNDVGRMLRKAVANAIRTQTSESKPKSTSGSSPSMNITRGLQTAEERAAAPESDCFCPTGLPQTSGQLQSSAVSEAYEVFLEDEGIDVDVEILAEVDVVECNNVPREFNTAITLFLSGNFRVGKSGDQNVGPTKSR
eukprot:jgi/Psemu1/285466/fgenesh1_pg.89_\